MDSKKSLLPTMPPPSKTIAKGPSSYSIPTTPILYGSTTPTQIANKNVIPSVAQTYSAPPTQRSYVTGKGSGNGNRINYSVPKRQVERVPGQLTVKEHIQMEQKRLNQQKTTVCVYQTDDSIPQNQQISIQEQQQRQREQESGVLFEPVISNTTNSLQTAQHTNTTNNVPNTNLINNTNNINNQNGNNTNINNNQPNNNPQPTNTTPLLPSPASRPRANAAPPKLTPAQQKKLGSQGGSGKVTAKRQMGKPESSTKNAKAKKATPPTQVIKNFVSNNPEVVISTPHKVYTYHQTSSAPPKGHLESGPPPLVMHQPPKKIPNAISYTNTLPGNGTVYTSKHEVPPLLKPRITQAQSRQKAEDEKYGQKLILFKKTAKSLAFKNAALCDEVSRLNHRINTIVDERKVLAKKLQHNERNRIRRLMTQFKKEEQALLATAQANNLNLKNGLSSNSLSPSTTTTRPPSTSSSTTSHSLKSRLINSGRAKKKELEGSEVKNVSNMNSINNTTPINNIHSHQVPQQQILYDYQHPNMLHHPSPHLIHQHQGITIHHQQMLRPPPPQPLPQQPHDPQKPYFEDHLQLESQQV